MKTIVGTYHFESLATAVRYYSNYEDNPEKVVERKLAEKEIHIGPPILRPGQKLQIHKGERRYFIEQE